MKKSNNKTIAEAGIKIKKVHVDAVIDLGFVKIHGLQELRRLVGKSMFIKYSDDGDINMRNAASSSVHVGEVWASYPVFDSYDVGDDRCYSNFIIRQKPIKDSEMRELAHTESRCNYRRLHESTPVSLLPMIYYEGDGDEMLVAVPK